MTVTHRPTKLSAIVLEDRLTDWAEQGGLRAIGQGGFRREIHKVGEVFILITLLKQTQRRRQSGVLPLCGIQKLIKYKAAAVFRKPKV